MIDFGNTYDFKVQTSLTEFCLLKFHGKLCCRGFARLFKLCVQNKNEVHTGASPNRGMYMYWLINNLSRLINNVSQ